MAILGKIGFFDATNHKLLEETNRPTYKIFLSELLNVNDVSTSNTKVNGEEPGGHDDELISRLMMLGHCKEKELALKILKTIKLVSDPYVLLHYLQVSSLLQTAVVPI
jgi:alpha-aminoadipic semialdehyde synthase